MAPNENRLQEIKADADCHSAVITSEAVEKFFEQFQLPDQKAVGISKADVALEVYKDMTTLFGLSRKDITTILQLSNNPEKTFDSLSKLFGNAASIFSGKNYLLSASTIDKLTNLQNREAFDKKLAELIDENSRHDKQFSMALMDIDHFKDVNDEYGHVAGDEVLAEFYKRFNNAQLRASDRTYRYGGEEIAILLPNTSCEEAMIVADRVSKEISKEAFQVSKFGTGIPISVSMGVAQYTNYKDDPTGNKLKENADQGLYILKGKRPIKGEEKPQEGLRGGIATPNKPIDQIEVSAIREQVGPVIGTSKKEHFLADSEVAA